MKNLQIGRRPCKKDVAERYAQRVASVVRHGSVDVVDNGALVRGAEDVLRKIVPK